MYSSYNNGFVTRDMIPGVWRLTAEQERNWLQMMASEMPGQTADTLLRIVTIELPDIPMAHDYQKRYEEASTNRGDLVPPIITSREQWAGRKADVEKIVKCLLKGTPPMVVISAVAVPRG